MSLVLVTIMIMFSHVNDGYDGLFYFSLFFNARCPTFYNPGKYDLAFSTSFPTFIYPPTLDM